MKLKQFIAIDKILNEGEIREYTHQKEAKHATFNTIQA